MTLAIMTYRAEWFLVASEAFFLLAVWAAFRMVSVLGMPRTAWLERIPNFGTTGFGVSFGLSAGYLILTTPEGLALTEWVTAQTLGMIVTLFGTLLGIAILELAWRKLPQRITGK